MNKRIRNIIIAVVVLGVLIGVYFLASGAIKKAEDKKAASETTLPTPSYKVCQLEVESLTNMKISLPNGEGDYTTQEFSLSEDKIKWLYTGNTSIPLDSVYFADIATALKDVVSETKLTGIGSDRLADYGLASPLCKIEITDANGTQRFAIGKLNSFNSMHYFMKEAEPETVYTIASTAYDAINHTLDDMLLQDTLPVISEAKLVSVKLSQGDKEYLYSYYSSGIKTDTTTQSGSDTTANGDYSDKWLLSVNGGEAERINNEAGELLLTDITGMTLYDCVTYDSASLDKYGLDNPIKAQITYKFTNTVTDSTTGKTTSVDTDKTVMLLIGSKDEKNCYYAMLSDSVLAYSTNIVALGGMLD